MNSAVVNPASHAGHAGHAGRPLRVLRFGASKHAGKGSEFPAGLTARYPFQFLVEVARNPLAMMIAMAGEYSDIAHYKIGPQHLFLFNHPDLIRLVARFGQRLHPGPDLHFVADCESTVNVEDDSTHSTRDYFIFA